MQLVKIKFLLYQSPILAFFMGLNMHSVQLWAEALPLRLVTLNANHRPSVLRRHSHSFFELALVLNGRCRWHIGRRGRVLVQSGEALLLKPETLHAEEAFPDERARIAWLGFDFGGATPTWCQRPVALGQDATEIACYFDAIAREYQLADARSQTRVGLALQSLLLLIERNAEGLPNMADSRPGLNPRQMRAVDSAAHYFRANLQDPLSVAQVAAYHSLCPGHFSRLFQQRNHASPRRFLRQERLKRAAELLTETEMTLKEIAAACGFVDAAHLCKSFKQDRRMTPKSFRARTRAKA